MNHRPLVSVLLLAVALGCGACSKRKPSVSKKPPGSESEEREPDTLRRIGLETVGTVKIWVLALSTVETEEDADAAVKQLGVISGYFDALLERAQQLPKVSAEEYKRVDDEVDSLLGEASSGLEPETQRIFLLPDSIKSKVLPANEKVIEKFREMSRAMLATRKGAAPNQPPNKPAGDATE